MQDVINEVIKESIEQQEKIIKEIAEQGYKYLVIKKEQVYE
jgi:hypothetical protein